jgi:hypothetical protein
VSVIDTGIDISQPNDRAISEGCQLLPAGQCHKRQSAPRASRLDGRSFKGRDGVVRPGIDSLSNLPGA